MLLWVIALLSIQQRIPTLGVKRLNTFSGLLWIIWRTLISSRNYVLWRMYLSQWSICWVIGVWLDGILISRLSLFRSLYLFVKLFNDFKQVEHIACLKILKQTKFFIFLWNLELFYDIFVFVTESLNSYKDYALSYISWFNKFFFRKCRLNYYLQ